MHQRTIGHHVTSAVGIGEVRLATADARGIPISDLERAVHHALERGLTFVDVADEEAAEQMCGAAVRALRLRDTAIVATRIAEIDARTPAHRDPLPECLPLRYVQERIEASLRATKLDALPLAMLPLRTAWLASRAWPELAGTCARLVREGKVVRWGARLDLAAAELEGRLADELVEAAQLDEPFCTMSIAFSACDRRGMPLVEGKLVGPAKPVAPAKPKPKSSGLILSLDDVAGDPLFAGIAPAAPAGEPVVMAPGKILPILAREPLAGGALAGTIGPGGKLAPRDDRNALDDDARTRIAVAVAKLSRLVRNDPPAARSCDAALAVLEQVSRPDNVEAATVAELALRFVLDRGVLALPRLHRRDHVATALTAMAALPLSKTVHERIEEILG